MTNSSSAQISILVIEDNEVHLYLLRQYLELSTLTIANLFTATNVREALEVLETESPDLIFLDLFLPDSNGLESYKIIEAKLKSAAIVVISSLSDMTTTLEALALGAEDYLVKGEFDDRVLDKTVRYSIERKRSEQRLQASEEKYRQIFSNNPSPMFIYDLDTFKILECNQAALDTYLYSKEEFINLNKLDLVAEHENPVLVPKSYIGVLTNKQKEIVRHKKKDGLVISVEPTYFFTEMNGKKVGQVQFTDVTEKIKLQLALAEEQMERQKSITAATITAQETERAELGRELHDNINQILVTALLYTDNLIVSQKTDFAMLQFIKSTIGESIKEIRKLTKGLVPPALDNIGLLQAIEGVLGNLRSLNTIAISSTMDDFSEEGVPEEMKLMIYRITQEQLNNVLKHSGADQVWVNLIRDVEGIWLTIKDNGKGCDLTEKRNGVGLQNINTRASLHNGTVTMESTPGNGFSLKVFFPIAYLD